MRRELLRHYESELQFIRESSKEFAREYSRVAARLELDGSVSPDPHVERLIESFALLAGRVRLKLEDEYPEITEALLTMMYPHYLRPVPSMAIAQFELNAAQGRASSGQRIEKGAVLYSRPVAGTGVSCRFRTCYPVTLWPVQVAGAQIVPASAVPGATGEYAAAIRLQLECGGGAAPGELRLDTLRFHLRGDGELPYTLYELLLNNTRRVMLRNSGDDSDTAGLRLGAGAVRPVGFERDEGLLPYPEHSFLGYRLLQEYFCFPEKFLFFDLAGLDTLPLDRLGERFEIVFLLSEFERKDRLRMLERAVRAEHFRLGCTPIVNLFQRPAEPIRLTHAASEYQVVPDVHSPMATEVYSIDRVTSTASYLEPAREYHPFYALRHNYTGEPADAFWYARRKASPRDADHGTDMWLSLVDLKFQPTRPAAETLSVMVTCTNRDLPPELPLQEDEYGELSLEGGTGLRVRATKPTPAVRAPLGSGLQWRLISHLALNYLSLVDRGREALQEILKLYDFTDSPAVRNQIAGIVNVSSEPHMARMVVAAGVVFALGVRVNVEFDENSFVGGGVYLMASVLERFLGLYSSINSFTQLTAATRQRRRTLRQWAPRAGEQIVL